MTAAARAAAELTISGVTGWLHDLLDPARPGVQTQRAALEAVSSLAQPERIAAVLRSLRADRQTVAGCGAQSYRHPLGFDKIMLINARPSFALYIHAWWPDTSWGTEHVHNHRFALASAILHGGYEMRVFRPDSTGALMTEFVERTSADGSGWQLDPVGNARLRLLTATRLTRGASYALAADALHTVIVEPRTLCLTLFLETARTSSTTRVFAEPGIAESTLTPKRALASEDYLRLLDGALAAITR